jgi:hypothetical protein
MTAEEYLKTKVIKFESLNETLEFTVYSLTKLMEEYHESELKKLRVTDVIGSFSLPEIWKMAQKYNCDDFVKIVEEVNRLNDL